MRKKYLTYKNEEEVPKTKQKTEMGSEKDDDVICGKNNLLNTDNVWARSSENGEQNIKPCRERLRQRKKYTAACHTHTIYFDRRAEQAEWASEIPMGSVLEITRDIDNQMEMAPDDHEPFIERSIEALTEFGSVADETTMPTKPDAIKALWLVNMQLQMLSEKIIPITI